EGRQNCRSSEAYSVGTGRLASARRPFPRSGVTPRRPKDQTELTHQPSRVRSRPSTAVDEAPALGGRRHHLALVFGWRPAATIFRAWPVPSGSGESGSHLEHGRTAL